MSNVLRKMKNKLSSISRPDSLNKGKGNKFFHTNVDSFHHVIINVNFHLQSTQATILSTLSVINAEGIFPPLYKTTAHFSFLLHILQV